ncbi:MAG: hypothetical protein AAGF94_00825 [Pseudomonadota bacterium]
MNRSDTFISLIVFASLAGTASAQDFTLTGKYEGLYACDNTTQGVPSTWSRPMSAGVVQKGDKFTIDLDYTDKQELGEEYSLYTGQFTISPDDTLVSGYFEACGGSFPTKELARFFPSAIMATPFSLSITSVWVSDQVPNMSGLTVQVCKWSLTRISTETPTIRTCNTSE